MFNFFHKIIIFISLIVSTLGGRMPVKAFDCSTVSEIPVTECQALVALYNSTNGSGWVANLNWLVTNTPSDWYGVTVTDGHVTFLSLDKNNLVGVIPPELASLGGLQHLFCETNHLTGSIPPELGNLSSLQRLWLGDNQLTGSIPPELGALSNLQSISLYSNQLTGNIPPELGALENLQMLYLNSNRLTGSIPPELVGLSNLARLYLHVNQLTGSIPPELGNLSNLQLLWLRDNQLTGSIPPELGNLTNLSQLILDTNHLSGSIPPELGNLSNLAYFQLYGNQLSGSIPAELANLSQVNYFYLDHNQLTGSIPSQLGNLTHLNLLGLADNRLSGSIPPELGNLSELRHLYLDHNYLTGSVPATFGNLGGLFQLNLSHNRLSGALPESLTNLTNLCLPFGGFICDSPDHGLDLSYNRLDVPAVPQALADFLAIRDPDWYLTQAVTETITPPDGGEIGSNDGSVNLIFQPGSAPGTITVTYVPMPTPAREVPDDLAFAGLAFSLEVADKGVYTFAQPVTVTVAYQEGNVGLQFDAFGQLFLLPEDTLKLYTQDESGFFWVDALTTCASPGGYVLDPAANTLTLTICQAGEFALLGEKQQNLLYLPVVGR